MHAQDGYAIQGANTSTCLSNARYCHTHNSTHNSKP
jgi:hypothetical protein